MTALGFEGEFLLEDQVRIKACGGAERLLGAQSCDGKSPGSEIGKEIGKAEDGEYEEEFIENAHRLQHGQPWGDSVLRTNL